MYIEFKIIRRPLYLIRYSSGQDLVASWDGYCYRELIRIESL